MDQVTGRIESFGAQGGLKPFLRLNVTIKSAFDSAIDLMSVNARVNVLFSEKERAVASIPNTYVGDANVEWHSRMFGPGDSNSLTFLWPVDFDLLGGIEDIRQNHDVDLSLWITFNGIERQQSQAPVSGRAVAGEIFDARTNTQGVTVTIAKSRWMELLTEWGYSPTRRDATQELTKELTKLIQETRQAKQQAEEAAAGAKQAAQLTAVTSLSEAYLEESKVLGKRSRTWGVISLVIAAGGTLAMIFYVRQSMTDNFNLPEAVIRAVVIAAIFGAFTLCLRIYEAYRHLEVVNRHRVNIGRTFEAFKAAQPTEKAKEVMAAITADNLLAFGKSGFGGKDSPNQGPLGGATELIRAVLETHSK
jgi:hypothetical protein